MNFLINSQIVPFRPNSDRDPFKIPADLSNRSQGLLLIDEIDIKGKYVIRKKAYAIIQDAAKNTHFAPVGYQFLDGEVVAITDNSVVFEQWDSSTGKRFGSRRVTKVF
jgi:hypothetical protein